MCATWRFCAPSTRAAGYHCRHRCRPIRCGSPECTGDCHKYSDHTRSAISLPTMRDSMWRPAFKLGDTPSAVEMAGFKKAERTDVALAVGDRFRADFNLEIGTTQDSVTVEATPVAVQSESGEISDVISGAQVSQLATNGRSLYSLAALTPGASSNMADYQSATPVGGSAQVSFNGLRREHNIYLIDGGENPRSWRRRHYQCHAVYGCYRRVSSAYFELRRGIRFVFRRHHDHGILSPARRTSMPAPGNSCATRIWTRTRTSATPHPSRIL